MIEGGGANDWNMTQQLTTCPAAHKAHFSFYSHSSASFFPSSPFWFIPTLINFKKKNLLFQPKRPPEWKSTHMTVRCSPSRWVLNMFFLFLLLCLTLLNVQIPDQTSQCLIFISGPFIWTHCLYYTFLNCQFGCGFDPLVPVSSPIQASAFSLLSW